MVAWNTPPTFTAGNVLTGAQMTILGNDLLAINGFVRKTADQSVTSSTVLVNDTHLTYPVVAGTYVMDWYLIGTSAANAAGDLNVAWTYPTASLATAFSMGPDISIASAGVSTGQWSANAVTLTSGTLFNSFGLSTFNLSIWLHTMFVFTATGNVQLQWAQNSSSASASTLKTGSHVVVRQVA